jgi:hypothetical protein
MAEQSQIDSDTIRKIRSRYPTAYISGTGGPWGIVRNVNDSHPLVIIFPTEAEARAAARDLGAIEKFSTPIPENCPDLYPD